MSRPNLGWFKNRFFSSPPHHRRQPARKYKLRASKTVGTNVYKFLWRFTHAPNYWFVLIFADSPKAAEVENEFHKLKMNFCIRMQIRSASEIKEEVESPRRRQLWSIVQELIIERCTCTWYGRMMCSWRTELKGCMLKIASTAESIMSWKVIEKAADSAILSSTSN